MRRPYIYVAASWRTPRQPEVVQALRDCGFQVYDFRDHGFSWREVHPDWQHWTAAQYLDGMAHPLAEAGFARDMNALRGADAAVLVQPCGRSASLEAGFAAGAGKPVYALLAEGQEPELMLKMARYMTASIDDLLQLMIHELFR